MGKTIPIWASDPFNDFLDYQQNLDDILNMSIRGISMLRAVPNAIEVLGKSTNEDVRASYQKEKLEHAKHRAALAQSEVDNGFPILYAQAVISLWSALESLIRTFLVAWIKNVPDAKTCDELKKVKMRFGEYESLVGDDRYFYLLDLLEDSIGTRRNPGIARFEALYSAFGLISKVDEVTAKDLFELYHIRNVLVHRRGIADKKTVESCPWLNLSVNQHVTVKHVDYRRYSQATTAYVIELIQRTRVYFGLERFEESVEISGNDHRKEDNA